MSYAVCEEYSGYNTVLHRSGYSQRNSNDFNRRIKRELNLSSYGLANYVTCGMNYLPYPNPMYLQSPLFPLKQNSGQLWSNVAGIDINSSYSRYNIPQLYNCYSSQINSRFPFSSMHHYQQESFSPFAFNYNLGENTQISEFCKQKFQEQNIMKKCSYQRTELKSDSNSTSKLLNDTKSTGSLNSFCHQEQKKQATTFENTRNLLSTAIILLILSIPLKEAE